jgi:ribulose kinase
MMTAKLDVYGTKAERAFAATIENGAVLAQFGAPTRQHAGPVLALNLLASSCPTLAETTMQHVQVLIQRLSVIAAAVIRITFETLACRAMVHLPASEVHRLRNQLSARRIK